MRKSFRASIVAGITGLTFVGGLAFAQFTGISPIFGQTETATLQQLENRGVSFSDELWPGEFVDATFTLKNPNPRAVKFMENGNWRAGDPVGTTACPADNYIFPVKQIKTGEIPAGGVVEVTIPDAVGLKAEAPDACQGQTAKFGWNFKIQAIPNAN